MHSPNQAVRITAIGVSAAYAVALYLSGLHLQHGLKHTLAYLPTAFGLGVVAFDLWLWKNPGVHRVTGRPRVEGTWIGTLQPHPDGHIPLGGNRGPIAAAVIIEQTYWSLAVTMLTAESASHSTAAVIRLNGDSRERHVLEYTYQNSPKQQHRPRSLPHVGASQLHIAGLNPNRISGAYWTDRLTAGDIEMHHVNRRTDYTTLAEVLDAKETAVGGP